MIDVVARLKAKTRITESGCWEFTGYLTPNGYGRVWWKGEKRYNHRISYEIFAGPIDDGMEIDHLCRNRACWRPSHLEMVTHRENTMRGVGFAPEKARQTACVNGHEFTELSTYIAPNGTRRCRPCRSETKRRSRERAARENAA